MLAFVVRLLCFTVCYHSIEMIACLEIPGPRLLSWSKVKGIFCAYMSPVGAGTFRRQVEDAFMSTDVARSALQGRDVAAAS